MEEVEKLDYYLQSILHLNKQMSQLSIIQAQGNLSFNDFSLD